MRFLKLSLFLIIVLPASAYSQTNVEVYASSPEISSVVISPNGDVLAYIKKSELENHLVISDVTNGPLLALDLGESYFIHTLEFADNDFLFIYEQRSIATSVGNGLGRMSSVSSGLAARYIRSLTVKVDEGSFKEIQGTPEGLRRSESAELAYGAGIINDYHPDIKRASLPLFNKRSGENSETLDIYDVDLNTGKKELIEIGNTNTIDWFTNSDGSINAREDFFYDGNDIGQHSIWWYDDDNRAQVIFEEATTEPSFLIAGTNKDKTELVFLRENDETKENGLYGLSSDGKISEKLISDESKSINKVIIDNKRVVHGIEYFGLTPSYDFFDEELTLQFIQIQNLFPNNSTFLESWSDDFKKIILFVTGNTSSGKYYLFDRDLMTVTFLLNAYPNIPDDQISEMTTLQYSIDQTTQIPAIITWPLHSTVDERSNLPLVVLPHGGPQDYDSLKFNWLAQLFSSEGYMVFQPNFRGSDGFGIDFLNAGENEWGGLIQDDISGGVLGLIEAGIVDPERICIIGEGFGGYTALMNSAKNNELYQCVVAINPISDLSRMMQSKENEYGKSHSNYYYWKNLIGDNESEDSRQELANFSPLNYADQYSSPVLLIHVQGRIPPYLILNKALKDVYKNNIYASLRQSELMESALKAANKEVQFEQIEKTTSWQGTTEIRMEIINIINEFMSDKL